MTTNLHVSRAIADQLLDELNRKRDEVHAEIVKCLLADDEFCIDTDWASLEENALGKCFAELDRAVKDYFQRMWEARRGGHKVDEMWDLITEAMREHGRSEAQRLRTMIASNEWDAIEEDKDLFFTFLTRRSSAENIRRALDVLENPDSYRSKENFVRNWRQKLYEWGKIVEPSTTYRDREFGPIDREVMAKIVELAAIST